MPSSDLESEEEPGDGRPEFSGHLASYERQLMDHLRETEARVDSYRLSIEKVEEGITVDFAIKVTIKFGKSEDGEPRTSRD